MVVLTGDNELVTAHVCAEVGLDAQKMVLGSELEALNDWALACSSRSAPRCLLACHPLSKSRVILALKPTPQPRGRLLLG